MNVRVDLSSSCCPGLKVMRAKSSTLARRLGGVRGLRHVPPQRTATGQTFETARAPSQQPSSSSLRLVAFHHRGHAAGLRKPHPNSTLHHSTLHLERPFTTGSRPNINGIRSWACAGHRPPRDNGHLASRNSRRPVCPAPQVPIMSPRLRSLHSLPDRS